MLVLKVFKGCSRVEEHVFRFYQRNTKVMMLKVGLHRGEVKLEVGLYDRYLGSD